MLVTVYIVLVLFVGLLVFDIYLLKNNEFREKVQNNLLVKVFNGVAINASNSDTGTPFLNYVKGRMLALIAIALVLVFIVTSM